MRDAEHHRLDNAGNRHQGALDRGRRDVLAAANDHVLAAPRDPQVAPLVQAAEIAGVQPAFGVDGRLVEPVVARHLGGRSQQDLAVGKAGMLEKLHFDQRHRLAGRAQHLHLFRSGRAGGLATVLGQPVAGRDPRTHAGQGRAHPLHQLRMHRCPTDADRLQAAQLPARHVRVIQEPRHHGRHRGPAIDLVALDQLEHFGGVVAAAGHHQCVADDHGAQQRLHLTDVKQGPGDQGDVMPGFVDLVRQLFRDLQRHVQAGEHGAMRQDNRFGLSRRTRGENDQRGVFLVLRAFEAMP